MDLWQIIVSALVLLILATCSSHGVWVDHDLSDDVTQEIPPKPKPEKPKKDDHDPYEVPQ